MYSSQWSVSVSWQNRRFHQPHRIHLATTVAPKTIRRRGQTSETKPIYIHSKQTSNNSSNNNNTLKQKFHILCSLAVDVLYFSSMLVLCKTQGLEKLALVARLLVPVLLHCSPNLSSKFSTRVRYDVSQ